MGLLPGGNYKLMVFRIGFFRRFMATLFWGNKKRT